MNREFYEPNRMYSQHDEAVTKVFGKPQALAQWRCRGGGPVFIKIGKSVHYLGSDLNAYLNERRVTTRDQPL